MTTDISRGHFPSKQWAQISQASGSAFEYKQIDVPSVPPDGALVRLQFSGVCGTDLHAWKGEWSLPTKPDLICGHEGVGKVEAVGSEVADATVKVGDTVGIQFINGSCGTCEFCITGDCMLCHQAQYSGYTVNGTFQQYCICKASCLVKIPDGIPLGTAAPILCAGVTVYKALKEANLNPGDLVAIAGAGGGLGTIACQYAKALGYKIVALSSGASKRRLCTEELGADHFIDYAESSDVVSEVQSVSSGGVHAAIVVAAAELPFHQAVQYVRPKGTVVAVGAPPSASIQADVLSTILRRLTIKGSCVGTVAETVDALNLARKFNIKIPYTLHDLKDLPGVFDMMAQGKVQGRIVLKIPDQGLGFS